MIPLKSYKHLYETRVNRAVWKVGGAIAAALLINAAVALLFVLPALGRHHDAARELSAQRETLAELRQKPVVQQATESGIASILRRIPPRMLLSELTTTIREAASRQDVLYVKLEQESAMEQQTNADTGQAEQPAPSASDQQGASHYRLTMYGDLHSLIAFVTRLQQEEQLLIVDSIKYTALDQTNESPSLQLLAQLPSWRAGRIGYSLELTFRAFELPASIGGKFENASVAMN